jgi:serine phosphatase RsbU (regulator of sigma subunit)
VAEILVAEAADGCAVVLFEDGQTRPVALHHRRPAGLEALRAAAERLGAALAAGSANQWRPERVWAAGAGSVADTEAGSSLVRPLRVRGAAVGALVLMSERPFDEEAGGLADEVAARLATAVDNGRLFEERTLIAQTLQASLLPPELPGIPGVDLAARHVAAGSGVEVGGDFYDVFRLDPRRFVVVLGDVCGRGVGAASLAALCRHTIRSAAVSATDPAAILAHVNEVLLRQATDAYEPRFCTAVVGVGAVQDDGVVVELALGGHPPPVVRRANGAVERVGVPGSLLGVRAVASTALTRLTLTAGDALVCVTDGVLERRRPGAIFGDDGLAAAASAAPSQSAGVLAASLEAAVLSFSEMEAGDDLAVLVVRAAECAQRPSSPRTVPAARAAAG